MLILGTMCSAALAAKKPDVLFILTDDQGYGDLARHGHPVLETPKLDRLHDESVRFDSFYVRPSCSPTGAAVMTGMLPAIAASTGVPRMRWGDTGCIEVKDHEGNLRVSLIKKFYFQYK